MPNAANIDRDGSQTPRGNVTPQLLMFLFFTCGCTLFLVSRIRELAVFKNAHIAKFLVCLGDLNWPKKHLRFSVA